MKKIQDGEDADWATLLGISQGRRGRLKGLLVPGFSCIHLRLILRPRFFAGLLYAVLYLLELPKYAFFKHGK